MRSQLSLVWGEQPRQPCWSHTNVCGATPGTKGEEQDGAEQGGHQERH